jgi:hypothetical protein
MTGNKTGRLVYERPGLRQDPRLRDQDEARVVRLQARIDRPVDKRPNKAAMPYNGYLVVKIKRKNPSRPPRL